MHQGDEGARALASGLQAIANVLGDLKTLSPELQKQALIAAYNPAMEKGDEGASDLERHLAILKDSLIEDVLNWLRSSWLSVVLNLTPDIILGEKAKGVGSFKIYLAGLEKKIFSKANKTRGAQNPKTRTAA